MGDDGGLQAGSQDALETGLLVDPTHTTYFVLKAQKYFLLDSS